MNLSIIIITMNRAEQLCEAIESCLGCSLPVETEILVVDNASKDNTREKVLDLVEKSEIIIRYFRMDENIGVGGGRNYAINECTGDYIYVLDDDAVIAEHNKNFFMDAIEIFEHNPDIATLTTQIYDTAWKANRLTNKHKPISDGMYECFMPCGGSHFLKRNCFDEPIYFPNKYGYEEIPTAMQAYNSGRVNVFYEKLLVIHKPKVNKWVIKDNKTHFINDIASQYIIKKCVYPKFVSPILWAVYNLRFFKYLRGSNLKKVGNDYIKHYSIYDGQFKRIGTRTFFKLLQSYGFSIL